MRKLLISLAVISGVLIAGAAVALYVFAPKLRSMARQRTQAYLQVRFKSTLQFADLDVSLYPQLRIVVSGVQLRHQGRTDVPPLFEIRELTINAHLLALLRPRPEVTSVRLDGLQIHMPPRRPGGEPLVHGTDQDLAKHYPIVIHEIRADEALLVILRKPANAQKPPREFEIHQLIMHDFDFSNPASFHALLTNPIPKGEIHCDGKFGPWQADDPRVTPVEAQYTFRDADMSTIKALKGILSSDGKFKGPLDYLEVQGETDIPDFALRISDHPVPLHTNYSAIVDGTNGNVILKNVVAKLAHTTLITNGEVVDMDRTVKGRTIIMNTVSQDGRIDDLLLLAVKNNPPIMRGAVRLKAKIQIPEGTDDLLDRLKIDGQFDVSDAHFTSETVQGKIDSLSRYAQGQPKNDDIGDQVSELRGAFKVDQSRVDFSKLTFGVAGALVSLTGDYQMDNGQMDFRGRLLLQAKLSQMTRGVKSFFLKAVDPFFKGKNAGTDVPIKITGTKDHPSFGLDFRDKTNKVTKN